MGLIKDEPWGGSIEGGSWGTHDCFSGGIDTDICIQREREREREIHMNIYMYICIGKEVLDLFWGTSFRLPVIQEDYVI